MAYMKWNKSFKIGIREIDTQHKMLFDMVNDYFVGVQGGSGQEALRELLERLAAYTLTHFRFEENCFERFGYEEAEEHKEAHRKLTRMITDLLTRSKKGERILSIEIGETMRSWLLGHTRDTDQRYKECFQASWDSERSHV